MARSPDSADEPKKKKKSKVDPFPRAVDTMFRLVASNHGQFSSMADGKANLLIQVNSIITTGSVSLLFARFGANPQLIIPGFLLVGVSVASIVLAVLATRPNVTQGTFTREDVALKRTNLLFFGNFHGASVEEYEWAVREMMKDPDYLYGSMTRDIYYTGLVLERKYRYLRWAYNVFMYGLVVAVIAFAIAVVAR